MVCQFQIHLEIEFEHGFSAVVSSSLCLEKTTVVQLPIFSFILYQMELSDIRALQIASLEVFDFKA